MSIDILIICYVFSELYLRKKRKISSLNKRVGYSILLGFVLLGLKLPMAWDMSKAGEGEGYIPMPHRGTDNLTDSEVELLGASIWSFTYFYPVWAPVFFAINEYRDYAYADYNQMAFDQKILEDCDMGKCGALLSFYADKNDRKNFLITLHRLKEKKNLECYRANAYARYAEQFNLTIEDMVEKYSIDLIDPIERGCTKVVNMKIKSCLNGLDIECLKLNMKYVNNIDSKKINTSLALLIGFMGKNNYLDKKEDYSDEQFLKFKNDATLILCESVNHEQKIHTVLKHQCKSY